VPSTGTGHPQHDIDPIAVSEWMLAQNGVME
jgi:hypothetical protein